MRIDPRHATRRPWVALGGAAICFYAGSLVSTDPAALGHLVGGTGLAVLGGGLTGLWARRVGRRTHARTGLGLWGLVLVVAGLVFAPAGADVARFVGGERTVLWTVSLLAAVTSLYLGFREYGAARHTLGTESVFEGDL
ncbi:hypothetical protein C479_02861 [Halovivax asiaticus JCM 14624]|uniref:Uncharacterized protein n=1 Tax=Halovivax asiaticus JCM 14624 TaxID=1227490 RepID=M0BRX0_9EURY|nr:hypothetical protein [Halovivax asiaticus]ELZ13751.1 hypothetical protein C479_02861 [Halovivax asiaticus JCM 14624]